MLSLCTTIQSCEIDSDVYSSLGRAPSKAGTTALGLANAARLTRAPIAAALITIREVFTMEILGSGMDSQPVIPGG